MSHSVQTCEKCKSPIKLGDFAYKQCMCWTCFCGEIEIMLQRINHYPSWMMREAEEHREILKHLRDVYAEILGKLNKL